MTIIKHEPWECPRCKVINAPWVAQCTCRPETKVKDFIGDDLVGEVMTSNKMALEASPKCQSESDHEWECLGMSTAGDTYRCKKCGEGRQYLLDGSVVKA